MNYEKIKNYAALSLLILSLLVFFYFAATRLITLAMPFFIAWAIAFAVRPVSHKISRKTGIGVKWVSLFMSVITVLGVMALAFGILSYAAREAWAFLSGLASDDRVFNIISGIIDSISGVFGEHGGSSEIENKISEAVYELIKTLLGKFVGFATNFVGYIPGIVIFIFISIVSTVYFSLDLEGVNGKVRAYLPEKAYTSLVFFKNKFLVALLSYLRSYLIIMAVVFCVLLVGFLILRVQYALMLALIFALLDMLPLLGVGSFMVPWAIFAMLSGDFSLGIGLLVLFAAAEIVRNLIEPKIVGKSLGIHPILTLVILYSSYSLFGFAGLLLTPVFTVILNTVINKDNSPEVGKRVGGK